MRPQTLGTSLIFAALAQAGCSAGGSSAGGSSVAGAHAGSSGLDLGGGNTGSGGSSGTGLNLGGGFGTGGGNASGGGADGNGGDGNAAASCDGKFRGYLRDFTVVAETVNGVTYAVSPDFEVVSHDATKQYADDRNMIQALLGSDRKPVYAGPAGGTISTTGPQNFATWFHDTPGVNLGQELAIQFEKDPSKPNDPNAYYFDSSSMGCPTAPTCYGFYPIDKQLLGNEGNNHNYHMTFELHLKFRYHAGQVFTFKGDDDVWAFIDQRRVVDLGGLHAAESAAVDVNALGLVEGQIYPLDFFWCERHITQSNFHIDTSLEVIDCGDPVVK